MILTINNRKKPLDDVRVRRAILAAIDRNAIVQGAADGFGRPIGSHYALGAPGFIDTTAMNPFDIEKAKKLLAEAGVKTPLELRLQLPPPPYARQGGEMIAAQLAQIGINVKIQNVEWAQWLSGTFGGAHDFDLTMVAHVEPFDLVKYTEPDYYWGYDSKKFRDLFVSIQNEENKKRRGRLAGRGPAPAGNRCGQRLPVPGGVPDHRTQGSEGPVAEHADRGERPGRYLVELMR